METQEALGPDVRTGSWSLPPMQCPKEVAQSVAGSKDVDQHTRSEELGPTDPYSFLFSSSAKEPQVPIILSVKCVHSNPHPYYLTELLQGCNR